MNEFEVGPLHCYDRGGDGLPVLWHHGTPNLGMPPEPLFADADRLAALLPERVVGVVSMAGLAPLGAEGLDWFAGMAPVGEAALGAATRGRAAREAFEEPEGDIGLNDGDGAALAGEWSWFGKVVGPAPGGGQVDDDLAYVARWRFDPATIGVPVLPMHGGRDRMVPSSHGEWLARHIPHAQWRLSTQDGHITVLNKAPQALEWLAGLSSGG
ncbi:alpha/beta hydrolase [Allorhizocola rhizosphaerae]|uniref:alpha/beta hydrolase n=1 Tax=Allorhizocola rhizosphaerae TaxID=1872709 RepID=UPI001B8D08C3|nr:alpha/beta hydrolase [Allorhizocola rhizosphaerae]